MAGCSYMLELFSALSFAVRFQQGAGSIPKVLFSLYTIASHSFSQRASLILPHSEGDLSHWNMLPARVTRTATSLSRRRHFCGGLSFCVTGREMKCIAKKTSWCCAAPLRVPPTASDVSPEIYYMYYSFCSL